MALSIFQILIAVLLVAVILLQAPGTGLSPVFGGGGEAYRSKRSAQKFLVIATIALSAILAILSITLLVLQNR
ncbi:MAG: preprotein translocase subunit SecG [Candidatus Levybacteria bacterium]|nr:preprotein translocase subunit SecG [Candidatus Levybacteria bacterium]